MIQPNLSGIEQLSLEILNRHRLHQIPVDPVALANKLGITVHNTIFSDESLSVVMTRHSHTSAIFVAHHDTATRKKHSIAHMLGHYLLHMQESATTVDHYQDLLDCPTSLQEPVPENKLHEFQANVFAAALLMPEENFRREWAKTPHTKTMAATFNVPNNLATSRARRLNLEKDPDGTAP